MDYREVHLARISDLRDGEMKEVTVGETRVLLARVGGEFHAVSATCPHYGAPLAEGALCGSRVVCPWHHAVFDVTNGDLKEPPALDGLMSYDVRVEGEQVLARLPVERAVLWRRKSFGTQSAAGSRFVGRVLTVVTTLRQQGRDVLEFLAQSCASAGRDGGGRARLLPQPP